MDGQGCVSWLEPSYPLSEIISLLNKSFLGWSFTGLTTLSTSLAGEYRFLCLGVGETSRAVDRRVSCDFVGVPNLFNLFLKSITGPGIFFLY